MDHQQLLSEWLGSEEGLKFTAEYEAKVELITGEGFAEPLEGTIDWTKVVTVVEKLVPILMAALGGGMTPEILVTLLPGIIRAFVPGINDSLVTMLQQFLTFVISRIPATT